SDHAGGIMEDGKSQMPCCCRGPDLLDRLPLPGSHCDQAYIRMLRGEGIEIGIVPLAVRTGLRPEQDHEPLLSLEKRDQWPLDPVEVRQREGGNRLADLLRRHGSGCFTCCCTNR